MRHRRADRSVRRCAALVAGGLAVVATAVVVPLASPGEPSSAPPLRGGASTGPAGGSTTSAAAAGAGHATAATSTTGGKLPAAPKGFSAQLGAIYGQIHAAITTLGVPTTGDGAVGGLPTKAAFAAMLSKLSAQDLAVLYAGTTKDSGWPSLSSTLNQLDLDAVAHPGAAASAFSTSGSASAGATKSASSTSSTSTSSAASPATSHAEAAPNDSTGSSTFPPTSPTGPFPEPPQVYTPTSPVGPTDLEPAVCPQPPPGPDLGAAAVYSAQVSADVITETVAGLPSTLGVIVDGTPAEFPDPARIALQVIGDADDILLDTMNYMSNENNDCGAVQADQLSSNIDNTTLNTYALMTLMESTLDDVESSVNTISGQVHVVQQSMDDQLTLTIEQDLAEPADTTPNLALELPGAVGGNLDSTPIGVKAIVTDAVQSIGAAGEAENPAATQYLAMANAALSGGNYVQAYDDFHNAYLEAVQ